MRWLLTVLIGTLVIGCVHDPMMPPKNIESPPAYSSKDLYSELSELDEPECSNIPPEAQDILKAIFSQDSFVYRLAFNPNNSSECAFMLQYMYNKRNFYFTEVYIHNLSTGETELISQDSLGGGAGERYFYWGGKYIIWSAGVFAGVYNTETKTEETRDGKVLGLSPSGKHIILYRWDGGKSRDELVDMATGEVLYSWVEGEGNGRFGTPLWQKDSLIVYLRRVDGEMQVRKIRVKDFNDKLLFKASGTLPGKPKNWISSSRFITNYGIVYDLDAKTTWNINSGCENKNFEYFVGDPFSDRVFGLKHKVVPHPSIEDRWLNTYHFHSLDQYGENERRVRFVFEDDF